MFVMPKVNTKKDNSPGLGVDEIVHHIFGSDFHPEYKARPPAPGIASTTQQKTACLEKVKTWVNQVLTETAESEQLPTEFAQQRLGPATVRFDISSNAGLFMIGKEGLNVNAQSSFGTIRSNACVFRGRWQYEITLCSSGVMQIGWATSSCQFSQEIGVGDTVNSYSYDGNRLRKWNVATSEYGESWQSGDTIGCTIDLEEGSLAFFRNGKCLGNAFDNLALGPGLVYFPAVSLAFSEQLTANFGAKPFRFPVPGFQPIQDPPVSELARADLLCKWLTQLLSLFERKYQLLNESTPKKPAETMTNHTFLMCLGDILMSSLGPLSSPYITEACLFPLFESTCSSSANKTGTGVRKLMLLLDMMWAFMEDHELQVCFKSTVNYIATRFQQVSLNLEYVDQKHCLEILTLLVQHYPTRQFLLEHVLFKKSRFARFTYVKPLDFSTLEELVKKPWWDTNKKDKLLEKNKTAYFKCSHQIKDAVISVEAMQVDLFKALLDNTDSTATRPSSRKIFLGKFRSFLQDNLRTVRILSMYQMPRHVALSCFYRLLKVFRQLWESEVLQDTVMISPRVFYDGSINYQHIDRVGGVFSHLVKAFREELIAALGPDHKILTVAKPTPEMGYPGLPGVVMENQQQDDRMRFVPATLMDESTGIIIPIMTRMMQQEQSTGRFIIEHYYVQQSHHTVDKVTPSGVIESESSLMELLDGLVLFYHSSVHAQIRKLNEVHTDIERYTTALTEAQVRLESMKKSEASSSSSDKPFSVLAHSCEVFELELKKQSRLLVWQRGSNFSPEKQSILAWFLRCTLRTVKLSASQGGLFSFLPDFYLDSMLETCHALRSYLPPTALLENVDGYEEMLIDLAEFLCNHFQDPRIVNDSCKDTMIHGLANFVCTPITMSALERVHAHSRVNMIHSLLRPYENRAWAQSNSVLVRIWQGCGFAFRYKTSPHLAKSLAPKLVHAESGLIFQTLDPCPSRIFQMHLKDVMLASDELSTPFLNSLLNQLNWAFSEFIGMLQEIQNVSNRPEQIVIEARQLKICATCFDLTLALLRVLEMIASIAPELFTDFNRPSAELLLSRLCQLVCQVLNRVSSLSGCFQHVVLLQKPDLDNVDHFPILSAVVGILLALLIDDISSFDDQTTAVPRVTKAVLTEPSFQMNSLKFVLGKNVQSVQPDHTTLPLKIKTFSLLEYANDVSVEEINLVRQMINVLSVSKSLVSDEDPIADEDLCTICYAFPIGARFKPCNHESCKSCIAHHLMNSDICFFCKAPIQQVVGTTDGKVLHNVEPRPPVLEPAVH